MADAFGLFKNQLSEDLTIPTCRKLCSYFGVTPAKTESILANEPQGLALLNHLESELKLTPNNVQELHDALTHLNMVRAAQKVEEFSRKLDYDQHMEKESSFCFYYMLSEIGDSISTSDIEKLCDWFKFEALEKQRCLEGSTLVFTNICRKKKILMQNNVNQLHEAVCCLHVSSNLRDILEGYQEIVKYPVFKLVIEVKGAPSKVAKVKSRLLATGRALVKALRSLFAKEYYVHLDSITEGSICLILKINPLVGFNKLLQDVHSGALAEDIKSIILEMESVESNTPPEDFSLKLSYDKEMCTATERDIISTGLAIDEKYRRVFNRNLTEFAEHLNPDLIVDYVKSKGVEIDEEKLRSYHSQRKKAVYFILTLLNQERYAYECFLKALEQHREYGHLIEKIKKSLKEYDGRDDWQWLPMSKYQTTALDHCLSSMAKESCKDACKYFVEVKLLENQDIAFIEKLPDGLNQWTILVLFLKGRGKIAYELLLDFFQEKNSPLFEDIESTEKKMKDKEERFNNMVTFQFQHHDIKEYTSVNQQLNILLIGKTGSGKSATANLLLGKQNLFPEVAGSSSGTKTVQVESAKIFEHFQVNVVDTPGLFDTTGTLGNEDIILEIMKTAQELPEGVHLFLFACRADTRFTDEEIETFYDIEAQFGKKLLDNCMLIMTHADTFKHEESFHDHLKKNPNLLKVYLKTTKKAIAVENADYGNLLIDRGMRQKQLMHAIVDVVKGNGWKTYSSIFFENAKKQLEDERIILQLHKQIYDEIFKYLFYTFANDPESTEGNGLSQCAVFCISKVLDENMVKRLPKHLNLNGLIQTACEWYEEFEKDLMRKKVEMNASSLQPSVLSTILEAFHKIPEETIKQIDTGQTTKDDIKEIISTFLQSRKHHQYPFIITDYITLLINEFTKQRQRLELIDCIHKKGCRVIKEYFRRKTFVERNYVITSYVSKGSIPPDLHCECLKVIPDKFKSGDWDDFLNEVLFQTLLGRLYTEDVITQSIIERVLSPLNKALIAAMVTLAPLMTINPIVGVPCTMGIMAFRVAINVFHFRKSRYPLIECSVCKGRHRDKRYKPMSWI